MRQSRRVRALGPESRGTGSEERCRQLHLDSSVYLDLPRSPADSTSTDSNAGGTSPARPFGGWEVGIPVGLAVGASPSGLPDLRIELVRVRWGSSTRFGSRRSCIERHGVSARTAASAADSDCGGAHYRMFPAPTTSSGSSCSDNSGSPTCMTSGSTGSLPYGASFNDSASRPGSRAAAVLPYLSTTGALLLGTVLFTDAAAAVRPHVVVPGLYVGAAMAAAAGAECVRRHAEARRGLRPARVVICSEVGRGGGGRALQGARAAWRAARGLAGAAGRSGRPVMELLQRLLVPSALLSIAADTWHVAHASSAALADALLGLAAAALSYKRLGRDIADGRIPPGHAQELAWRRCHKTAARRLARHLGDLPASPPLRPALEAWERCGIAAGLAVDGAPLCGVVDSLAMCRTAAAAAGVGVGVGGDTAGCGSAGGAGVQAGGGGAGSWGRRAQGGQLVLSFSYRGRRKLDKLYDGARGVHEAAKVPPQGAAGTVPGVPAGPQSGAPAGTAVTEAPATQRTPSGQLASQDTTPSRPLPPPHSNTQLPQQQQKQEQQPDPPAPGTLQGVPSSSLQRGLPRAASASSLKLMDAAAVSVGGAAAGGRAGGAAGGAGAQGSSPGCGASPAPTPTTHAASPPLPAPSLASAAAAAAGTTAGAGQQGEARATPPPAPLPPVSSSPASWEPKPVQPSTAVGANPPAGPTAPTAADWDLHRILPARAAQLMAAEQAAVEALGLPLYGRADHAYGTQDAVLRSGGQLAYMSYRLGLTCRAVYLIAVFAPFCTLGVGLLLLSSLLVRWAATGASNRSNSRHTRATGTRRSVSVEANSRAGQSPAAATTRAAPTAGDVATATASVTRPGTAADADAAAGRTSTALSSTAPVTAIGQSPAAGTASPAASSSSWAHRAALRCRRAAWSLLLGGCRRSGAAFIKWGQWAATRVDLFPDDFCEALGSLHDRAPTHSFAFTRRQVESAFGCPLESLFESFDPRPVASGSIAQVHHALLRSPDGCRLLEVAVKVVHPRVALRIRQDFALLRPAAAALGRLPSLRQLSLPETVSQFSSTMTAQADLRVEAAHLRRFYANFARVAHKVLTPRPLPGMVRPEVMVETWEAGRSVSHYIRQPSPVNSTVVSLGVDTYLQMLLADNFVHTDLHPGNIMVRLVDEQGRPVGLPGERPPLTPPPQRPNADAGAEVRNGTGSKPSGGARSGGSGRGDAGDGNGGGGGGGSTAEAGVQLVLLDFGLAEELTPAVRHHFISFLHHLLAGNGVAAARHLLQWTERPQACPDPAALTAAMVRLAAERCDVHSPQGIDLDAVMKDVLRLARRHGVTIDSCYAALVISVCVIVGFAASMDPRVNLVDPAVPAMLMHALTGRVIGRLHSN